MYVTGRALYLFVHGLWGPVYCTLLIALYSTTFLMGDTVIFLLIRYILCTIVMHVSSDPESCVDSNGVSVLQWIIKVVKLTIFQEPRVKVLPTQSFFSKSAGPGCC